MNSQTFQTYAIKTSLNWSSEEPANKENLEELLKFLDINLNEQTNGSIEAALSKRLRAAQMAKNQERDEAMRQSDFHSDNLKEELQGNIESLKNMCMERSQFSLKDEAFSELMEGYQSGIEASHSVLSYLEEQIQNPKEEVSPPQALGRACTELTESLDMMPRSVQRIQQTSLAQFTFRQEKVSVAIVMLAVSEDFYEIAEKITHVISKMQNYYAELLNMFNAITYLVNRFQKMYTDILSLTAKYSKSQMSRTSFSWDDKDSLVDFPKDKMTYKSKGKQKLYDDLAKILRPHHKVKNVDEAIVTDMPGYALLYLFNLDEGRLKPSHVCEENIIEPNAYDFYPQGGSSLEDLTPKNWMLCLGSSDEVPQLIQEISQADSPMGIEMHTSLLQNASGEPKWYVSPEGFNGILKSVSKLLEGVTNKRSAIPETEGEFYKTWHGSANDSLTLNALAQSINGTMGTINGKDTQATYEFNQIVESIDANRKLFGEMLSAVTSMRRSMVS